MGDAKRSIWYTSFGDRDEMPAPDMTIAVTRPHPGVLQVLMDRPARMNALDHDLVSSLAGSISDAGARVVVIGSTTPTCFSAGVDLTLDDEERAEVSRGLYRLYDLMRTSPAILIAAASGHAIGGGAQLMIASDLRVAAPDVSIRFVGPGHGLAVGAWGLPGLIGRGRAMDLMLSMRPVGADEALSIGLVEKIEADPLAHALEYARHVTTLSPAAVERLKQIAAIPGEREALAAEAALNDPWDGSLPAPQAKDG